MDNFSHSLCILLIVLPPDAETAAAALIEWESLHGFRSRYCHCYGSRFAFHRQYYCQIMSVLWCATNIFQSLTRLGPNATIERVNSTIKSAFQSLMSQTRYLPDQW